MKVRIFGGGSEELGAVRYQVEWITINPSAKDNDCIDPDTDTETHLEYRSDKDTATTHLRTTNPIESTFATMRLRTAKTRLCLARWHSDYGFQVNEKRGTTLSQTEWHRPPGPRCSRACVLKTDYKKRKLRESPLEFFHPQHLQKSRQVSAYPR